MKQIKTFTFALKMKAESFQSSSEGFLPLTAAAGFTPAVTRSSLLMHASVRVKRPCTRRTEG